MILKPISGLTAPPYNYGKSLSISVSKVQGRWFPENNLKRTCISEGWFIFIRQKIQAHIWVFTTTTIIESFKVYSFAF